MVLGGATEALLGGVSFALLAERIAAGDTRGLQGGPIGVSGDNNSVPVFAHLTQAGVTRRDRSGTVSTVVHSTGLTLLLVHAIALLASGA